MGCEDGSRGIFGMESGPGVPGGMIGVIKKLKMVMLTYQEQSH